MKLNYQTKWIWTQNVVGCLPNGRFLFAKYSQKSHGENVTCTGGTFAARFIEPKDFPRHLKQSTLPAAHTEGSAGRDEFT